MLYIYIFFYLYIGWKFTLLCFLSDHFEWNINYKVTESMVTIKMVIFCTIHFHLASDVGRRHHRQPATQNQFFLLNVHLTVDCKEMRIFTLLSNITGQADKWNNVMTLKNSAMLKVLYWSFLKDEITLEKDSRINDNFRLVKMQTVSCRFLVYTI